MQPTNQHRSGGWLDPDSRWLIGLCVARMASTLTFNTYAATQPLLMVEWQMSAAQAGWIHASFYMGYLTSLFGVGLMTNRYGAKRTVLLAGMAASCSAFLFALFAEDFRSGLILYGASALCFGGSYTPVLTVIAERISGKRRGRAIGWYIAAGSLGYALSLSLSGAMMAYSGWRSAFYATACGPFVGTLIAFSVLRHTPNLIPERSPTQNTVSLWRTVLLNKPIMLVILGYTFHSWELLGMRSWLPTFLTVCLALGGRDGAAAASLGASVSALLSVASMAGTIAGGAGSDRWGRTVVIIGFSFISLLCSFSMGWLIAAPVGMVIGVGLLYSITTIGDSPVYSTALTELVPHYALGTAYAIRSVMGFGAGVISPVVFGLVLEGVRGFPGIHPSVAWGLAFASLGVVGLCGPLGMLWLRTLPQSAQMAGGLR